MTAWAISCGFEASGASADVRAERRRAGKALRLNRVIHTDLPCDPTFAEAMRHGLQPGEPLEPA